MSDVQISRHDGDLMALRFLRDNGAHTMGPINDEGAFAAALTFLDLEKKGYVSRVAFGGGWVQFTITAAGVERLDAADRPGGH